MSNLPAEKLFQIYMGLLSRRESEEIYRLNEPVGEGIMKHLHIARGIELVYSELESYNPSYQDERKDVDALEIMYIVDGHGEFELHNRQVVSGEKGDVMIFNSKSAVKKALLGKSGMNCISIILFTDDTISYLNTFLESSDFCSSNFFYDIRKNDSVPVFSCSPLLEKLFLETIRLPQAYSRHTVKLSVIHILILLIQKFKEKDSGEFRPGKGNSGKGRYEREDSYFSGSSGRKVQNARRIINANLDKEISIEELADKVNLNRTSLQKVFKEMYGLTVNEYRTKARLQLAKNLLVSTDLSITEIAGRSGYANSSKFSQVFKKNEGMLPKDWRK
jgi:AraC-like DNA-binding protein